MGPEQNPRVSLVPKLFSRDGNIDKDSLIKDGIKDGVPEQLETIRRPALVFLTQFTGAISGSGTLHAVSSLGRYDLAVFGSSLTVIQGNVPYQFVMPSEDVPYFFAASSQTNKFLLKGAAGAYVGDVTGYPTVAITKVTNANYPGATLGGAVYLDGTYYVMDVRGNIYGSAISDPLTWTALNFIQMDAGQAGPMGIARHLNYLVAFGSAKTQFFYDAANPAPGSPLSPMMNAQFNIGCACMKSVQSLNDMLIFAASGPQSGTRVAMFIGLQLKIISTPSVERILQGVQLSDLTVSSTVINSRGHDLYVLNLPTGFGKDFSLVYDMTADDWYVWTSYLDSVNQTGVPTVTGRIKLLMPSSSGLTGYTDRGNAYSWTPYSAYDVYNPAQQMQIETLVRTEKIDGRIINYKFLQALYVLADTVTGSVCYIRYSDDDGLTWSAWGSVDLGSNRKQLRRLGKFRQRIFEIRLSTFFEQRLSALELDTMIGNS